MKRILTLFVIIATIITLSGCQEAFDFDTMYFGTQASAEADSTGFTEYSIAYEIRYDGSVYRSENGGESVNIGKLEREVIRDIDGKIEDISDEAWGQTFTDVPPGGAASFIEITTGDQKQHISWNRAAPQTAPAGAKELYELLEEKVQF